MYGDNKVYPLDKLTNPKIEKSIFHLEDGIEVPSPTAGEMTTVSAVVRRVVQVRPSDSLQAQLALRRVSSGCSCQKSASLPPGCHVHHDRSGFRLRLPRQRVDLSGSRAHITSSFIDFQ